MQINLMPGLASRPESPIRISIEVPNTPRFILNLVKERFCHVKQLISFICSQSALDETVKYLLMLEDSVIVNVDSIRDND